MIDHFAGIYIQTYKPAFSFALFLTLLFLPTVFCVTLAALLLHHFNKNKKIETTNSNLKLTTAFVALLFCLFLPNVTFIAAGSLAAVCFIIKYIEWTLRIRYGLSFAEQKNASSKRFLIIGGGFSGLCVGHFFRLMKLNFQLVEKGSEIGGTWFWNRYPGVGCDVVSHLYSLSFFRNPNWTKSFSLGDEIHSYLKQFWHFARLEENTRLNTTVNSMEWSDETNVWKVTIDNQEEHFDWVISCIGGLHKPIRPKFSGHFDGIQVHSAEWNSEIELRGKRVALIGTGASSIQLLPRLVNDHDIKSVTMFQRTAPFVFPRNQVVFSDSFKWLMSIYPFGIMWRWMEYLTRELVFVAILKNYTGFFNKFMRKSFESLVSRTIDDPKLARKLIPNFRLGCKRILFADDYYSCMNSPKFHLETDEIMKLTAFGIETAVTCHEFDVIVYATGFQLMHNNIQMKQFEAKYTDKGNVKTFFGTFLPNIPNYATLLGPMTVLGHNSILVMIGLF
jgi:cation diffusion facilitator CzcD-associated flavoprotein CzcO